MKKLICLLLILANGWLMAQNKMVVTIHGEKISYDLRMSTADRDIMVAASPPVEGTLIYNTTTKCHEVWDGTGWYNYCQGASGAVVSAYACNAGFTGKIVQYTDRTGGVLFDATQTIIATVERLGPYNITATALGVTFSASGTFTILAPQNIILTATGSPTGGDLIVGPNLVDFTLDTTPGCTFSFIVQRDAPGPVDPD